MKLLVQEYLETHTFGDLVRDHGVYASFSKSGHKFSLNYDQIEAKEADPLAQECRGLVLSTPDGSVFKKEIVVDGKVVNREDLPVGETVILAFPMRRFFNHGQGAAAEINWSDPKLTVLEKLDGTLCIVYWDKFTGQWCVATRSVPEADMLMDNGIFTFRTLFEKALEETTGYPFEGFKWFLAKECTYCFELTTRYNRIVVDYPTNGVTLLAIRNLVTLSEVDFDHPYFDGLPKKLPIVQSYSLGSVEKTLEWVASVNPMEHEGVVVKVGEARIKVKSPAYVAYNKVRDSLASSPRNIVELILSEKDDDVIPMLPEEIVKNLQMIKSGIQLAIREHDEAYQIAKAEADKILLGDKKTFAILVTKDKGLWTAPFFQIFDGKATNMKDFITKNRKDGTWGNSFLDKMLELSKHQY